MKKKGEVDEMIDFVADGPNDLKHGTILSDEEICTHCKGSGYDDSTGKICEWCSGNGIMMENKGEDFGGIFFTTDDDEDIIDLEDDTVIKLEEQINESLDMFRRFKKYN